jgi:methyltransferase (TIGR00027 family)
MRQGHASRTAEYNALFRAFESALPADRRLLEEPLARRFLRGPAAWVPALAAVPGLRSLVPRFVDRRWPGVRPSVIARTRLIDEWIAAGIDADIEQVVLLGAGFDTRAYRLPCLRALPVFEVDHPDTQARKRAVLARALPALPANVRFVPCDFAAGALAAAMAGAGYREPARTFFLWEGVTGYLTEAAVDATLRWCARAAPGSLLLFTYLHRDVLTRPEAFAGSARLFASLRRFREPLRFGLDPAALPGYLAARGLRLERDLGLAEVRACVYGDAARDMRGHEFYRVALARVAQHAADAGNRHGRTP